MGKSNEEFLEEMRPSAERRLVGGLVMRKLAEVEEIEISDEDIQSETDRLFEMSTGDEAEQESLDNLRQFLDSQSTRDNIRSSLHSRRVLERLTDITQGKLDETDEEPEEETSLEPADDEPAEDETAAETTAEASDEDQPSA